MLTRPLLIPSVNVKNFRSFSSDFVHEVEALCDHLMTASKANAIVDLQDLMLRATLDSFGRLAMGEDFGCISQKPIIKDGRFALPDVEFMSAFDFVNATVSQRMTNPLWRLAERLNGTAKKIKDCQKIMFGVANKIIAGKRAKMAKGEGAAGEDATGKDMVGLGSRRSGSTLQSLTLDLYLQA
jgi:hypothetical protein